MSKKINKLSVFLSLILRHKPEVINIKLDKYGYANVSELIEGVNNSGRFLDFELLKLIVDTDGRYSFNEDLTKVRANQGHSINVDVELEEKVPPMILYHGTAVSNVDSIMKKGINKGKRLHVHLTDNKENALSKGKRYGEPVALVIDAEQMHKDNFKFFVSKNNVWLTEFVPSKYVKVKE